MEEGEKEREGKAKREKRARTREGPTITKIRLITLRYVFILAGLPPSTFFFFFAATATQSSIPFEFLWRNSWTAAAGENKT